MTDTERAAIVTLSAALDDLQRRQRLALITGLVSILIVVGALAAAFVLELHTRGAVRVVSRSPCSRLTTEACAHKLAPFLRDELRRLEPRPRARAQPGQPSSRTGATRRNPSRPTSGATGRPGLEATRRPGPPPTRRPSTRHRSRRDRSPPTPRPRRRQPSRTPGRDASPPPASSPTPGAPEPAPAPAPEPAPSRPPVDLHFPPIGPVTLPPVCTSVVDVNC